MQRSTNDILIFLIVTTIIILFMAAFIITIIYVYRRKQIVWLKNMESVKANYEKNLLSASLEIKEETFMHISREIHDNISLSLSLAKLHLNTLDLKNKSKTKEQLKKSVDLLSTSIKELSEMSKSLNTELIIQQGLLKALENEIKRIEETKLFNLKYHVEGDPIYLDAQKELIIFRIIQECFNNIIKHSGANSTELKLNYNAPKLYVDICDNGKGFKNENIASETQAGLKNMRSRIGIINGTMKINSIPGHGTFLSFIIPYE